MKKIIGLLSLTLVLSTGSMVSASEIKNNKNYNLDIEMENLLNTSFAGKQDDVHYKFLDEELIGNTLVRTYIEKGSTDEISYSIEIPKEILIQANGEKNSEEKINKIYERLAELYVETDSWLKLNVLANVENDMYMMASIEIDEKAKEETAKKTDIILKAIEDKDKNVEIIITNKENYIDNDVSKLKYEYIKFDNKEKSIEVLKEIKKELNDKNKFLYFSLGLVIMIIVIVLAIKKRKIRG